MTRHELETLWTVCSNLETIVLTPGADVPESFRTNLAEAFRILRFASDNIKHEEKQ